MKAVPLPKEVRLTQPAALLCLKGRGAPALLEACGITPPERPNHLRQPRPGQWCLRLGAGEYLVADDDDARAFEPLRERHRELATPACHLLLRADRCIDLNGPAATDRLLQLCDIDERRLIDEPDALALVFCAGVSVTLHARPSAAATGWRIWCDPSYAGHVLHAIAALDFHQSAPLHLRSPRQDP
jgi:sarcosine oxidase subunit gamma